MEQNIDIKENYIYQLDSKLLAILLLDKSSGKNIIWATDHYADRGVGYQSSDEITIDSITHRNGSVIKPRTTKSKKEQAIRVRDKAEVFTPSWVCNSQNNLVDSAWFGKSFRKCSHIPLYRLHHESGYSDPPNDRPFACKYFRLSSA